MKTVIVIIMSAFHSNRKNRKAISVSFLLVVFITITSFGQVLLPKLVSDGMVLQRDANVNIWGWAGIGAKVSVSFLGSTYEWPMIMVNGKFNSIT